MWWNVAGDYEYFFVRKMLVIRSGDMQVPKMSRIKGPPENRRYGCVQEKIQNL
jgi:hypothetical protein